MYYNNIAGFNQFSALSIACPHTHPSLIITARSTFPR
jgi:hypothetical protein